MDINAHLTPEGFASLAETAKGPLKRVIPEGHRTKLIELGFIEQKLGGLLPTEIGQMRWARGK